MTEAYYKPKPYRVMVYKTAPTAMRIFIDKTVEYQPFIAMLADFMQITSKTSHPNRGWEFDGLLVEGYAIDEIVEWVMGYNHRDETVGWHKEQIVSPINGTTEVWVKNI